MLKLRWDRVCIALPGRVKRILGDKVFLDYDGVEHEACKTDFEVNVGDYVLAQAGFLIQKLDEKEARETLKLYGGLRP